MAIPLPSLMRKWRERDFARGGPPLTQRLVLKLWAFAARRPRFYHALSQMLMPLLARLAGSRGNFTCAAFCRRLDADARSAGAARQDLPHALSRAVEASAMKTSDEIAPRCSDASAQHSA